MYPNTIAIDRQDLGEVILEHLGLGGHGFVGTGLLPVLPVEKESGDYKKIVFSELDKQILNNSKVSGAGYNRVNRTLTKDSYSCKKKGLEEPLDDDDVARLGEFPAEVATATVASFNNLRAQEIRIAGKLFNTDTFGSSFQKNAGALWSEKDTCDPAADVRAARKVIEGNIGGFSHPELRLVLTFNSAVLDFILASASLADRVKYTRAIGKGEVSLSELAAYFGVDEVRVSTGRVSGSYIWSSSYAMLALVSESQALKQIPRLGNTFLWTDSTPTNNVVQTYRNEEKEEDIVRVKHNVDEKVITPACACLLTGITGG